MSVMELTHVLDPRKFPEFEVVAIADLLTYPSTDHDVNTAGAIRDKWEDTPDEITALIDSIDEHGMCSVIGVSGGEVVNGHHRLAALIELGYTHAPVWNSDYEDAYDTAEDTFYADIWYPLIPRP